VNKIIVFLDIIHRPVFFYLKHTTFRNWVLSPSSGEILLSWAQSIELVPTSVHQHQYKVGYVNQTQHKPSARVKTDNKNIKYSTHVRPSNYVHTVRCRGLRPWLVRWVLAWMVGFIDTLFIQLGATGNTAVSLIYTLYSSPLHTHSSSQSSLNLTWQTDFITVSLSIQITHEVFFSQPNSLLAIFLPFRKTRLNSIPLLPSSRPSRLAWNSTTFFQTELFFITTLHGPRRKQ
jgi:hypothetical protein